MLSLMDELLEVGDLVWCDSVVGMPGSVMKAEVITGHREPQAGMVWVRQVATPAVPTLVDGGWVTEWPASQIMHATR